MWRLALRNLTRNRWRTLLTAGGVAVAVFLLTWTNGLMGAMEAAMVRGATSVETGQVQVHHPDWVERPGLYDHFERSDDLLARLDAVDGVAGVSARIHVYGLVGNEDTSQVASITGVDPAREAEATLAAESVIEGRWLSDTPADLPGPREAVLGVRLAELLDAEVGDSLVLFVNAADGSLGNDALTIVGLARTGSAAVDRAGVYMHYDDAAWASALEGRAHDLTIAVADLAQVDVVADRVAAAVAEWDAAQDEPLGLVVRSWDEILPELAQMLDMSRGSIWLTYLIIFAIAALGLINTQRMGALERRREFGVLLSIGMRPWRLGSLVLAETVVVAGLGAILGGIAGGGANLWYARNGFDMAAFASSDVDFSVMGIAFTETIAFPWAWDDVLVPMLAVLAMAALCGLVPARYAVRLNAVSAVAGRS